MSPAAQGRTWRNARSPLLLRDAQSGTGGTSCLWDWEGRREVDPVKGGKCCSEEKRRANNQGGVFWCGRASRRTHGNAAVQLRSVTRSTLRCCGCWCLLCLSSSERARTLNFVRDEVKVRTDTGAAQTVFPNRMQGLSSRAHAFSVEALVGKPCKRIKVSEEHEPSSADISGDRSIFPGEDAFA